MSVVSLPGEIWKPVNIYPYCIAYEVSNLGRVKSIDREICYTKSSGSIKWYHAHERLLCPFLNERGPRVILKLSPIKKTFYVAKLVAMTFNYIDGCGKLFVGHKDGNLENNDASNLTWENSKRDCQKLLYKSDTVNRTNLDKLWRDEISTKVWVAIKCIETGKEFNSIREAARFYNIPDWRIYTAFYKCNGYCKLLNLTFERMNRL